MSIYSSQFVSEGEYFDTLRSNVERDFDKTVTRVEENFGFSQERLDNGIFDIREDVTIGKGRATEDFKFTGENLNRQLAQVAQSTFRRFVRDAPNMPTQSSLQNLATRGARIDKERNDFLNQRQFDRSIFDFDKVERRATRDYDLDSRINLTNRDRGIEDAEDSRDDNLLGLNRTQSSTLDDLLRSNSASSFSQVNPLQANLSPFSGQNGLQYSSFNPNQVSSSKFGSIFNRFF